MKLTKIEAAALLEISYYSLYHNAWKPKTCEKLSNKGLVVIGDKFVEITKEGKKMLDTAWRITHKGQG
jgi:Mn-dependent DtxR family transcriptional regulator